MAPRSPESKLYQEAASRGRCCDGDPGEGWPPSLLHNNIAQSPQPCQAPWAVDLLPSWTPAPTAPSLGTWSFVLWSASPSPWQNTQERWQESGRGHSRTTVLQRAVWPLKEWVLPFPFGLGQVSFK